MRALGKKLNSRRGATMLMALLLLTVAVMVSAVVITAALTNAKRLQAERDQQQAYLTVSSAAELLLAALDGQSYVAKETRVETRTETVTAGETADAPPVVLVDTNSSDWNKTGEDYPAKGDFQPLLESAVAYLPYNGSRPGSFSKNFTMAVEGLQTVKVSFTMAPDYGITALLELDPDSGAGRYKMYLTLAGNLTGPVNETKIDTTAENETTTVHTTTSTREFVIRWDHPVVGKGTPAK